MRSQLLFLSCILLAVTVRAQDKDYAEKAAELQKEAWGNVSAEFKATSVPANLSNESAVVLARSYTALWTSGSRFKLALLGAGFTKHMEKTVTFHERVKINDKSALENFSTIEYQKKLDNSTRLLLTASLKNTKNTFIGAKVIKPNGKEVMVNTSEEVLLENDSKDKKGKLAIPDLQVGDILDYYVTSVDVDENFEGESFADNENIFILADEYPVLYYSIDFQFDKKVKTKYIYANGVPHFTESHDKDDNLLLSLKLHNLPKYVSKLWTSPLRQYPYIEIGGAYMSNLNRGDKVIAKENSMLEGERDIFETSFVELPGFDDIEKKTKKYFGSKRNLKDAPLDSVMKVMYDICKFECFCYYSSDDIDNMTNMNYRLPNSRVIAALMSMMLTDMEIEHDVLLVASRNSNTLENVYGRGDFDAAIRINNGAKEMYMFFADPFTHFNEIPEQYQGEKVMVMHPKRHSSQHYSFTYSENVLPVTPSDKNSSEEYIHVSLSPDNMQRLKIDRTVKETGAIRHYDQKLLVPVGDVDNGYTDMVKGPSLKERLSESMTMRKKIDAFNDALAKERGEQEKNFTSEIKGVYDQDPKQVTGFKIVNNDLEDKAPVFEFNEAFALDNMVKRAGNNYIIDAGKLTGDFLTLDDKDKKRDVDVYMPVARSFSYTIVIDIPQGYTAKGMEEMNTQKSNRTGSFISSASVSGNKLTINVKRTYANNFEKASDWPSMVDVINAASDFNSKKILFEKQN